MTWLYRDGADLCHAGLARSRSSVQQSEGSASSLQRTSFSSWGEAAGADAPVNAAGDKPSAKEKLAAAFAPVKQGWSLLTQPGRQLLETCRESDEDKGSMRAAAAAAVDEADAESVQARDDVASPLNSARGPASPSTTGPPTPRQEFEADRTAASSPAEAGTPLAGAPQLLPQQQQQAEGDSGEEGTQRQPRRLALGAWVAKKYSALKRVRPCFLSALAASVPIPSCPSMRACLMSDTCLEGT
jgi:hypothetical protein